MPATLQISVVVSTFERPQHLRRCLLSLAHQQGVEGGFEVIVTDDGSRDETPELVHRFAASAPFPVRFVTHQHGGFQLARCRNSGVRIAEAPYILFTDGDCVFPTNHLRRHLQAARPGWVRAGECIRLDHRCTAAIDDAAIASGEFTRLCHYADVLRMRWIHAKGVFYDWMRHPLKPKLVGNNIGIWKSQLESINGFDEEFRGWGCEDDDLADRLRRRGQRILSVIGSTYGYHLWHEPHSTAPQKWGDGGNVNYLRRKSRLTQCLRGLRRREICDLTVRVRATPEHKQLARQAADLFRGRGDRAEVELIIGNAAPRTSNDATSSSECRFLVIVDDDQRYAAHDASAAVEVLRIGANRWQESLLAQLEGALLGKHLASADSNGAAPRPAAA